jgi:RluA family pseudouridine synthase
MQKRILTVARDDARELLRFLRQRLELSDEQAATLITQGAVWRGGRRVQSPALESAIQKLLPGERLVVYLEPLQLPKSVAPRVVYEDANLLIVDKPAGLDSQPGRRGGPSLLSLLPAPLYLVHRLDADASGLLVLARNPGTAAALQEGILRGMIDRQYLAVVDGVPRPSEGRIDLRIGRAHEKSPAAGAKSALGLRQQAHPTQSSQGQPATTHYRLMPTQPAELSGTSLVWLRLETGRTHQIRVHLSAIGHPIVGDTLYGGRLGPRLFLHASRLCLPIGGRNSEPGKGFPPRIFSSPPPACFGGTEQAVQPTTEA